MATTSAAQDTYTQYQRWRAERETAAELHSRQRADESFSALILRSSPVAEELEQAGLTAAAEVVRLLVDCCLSLELQNQVMFRQLTEARPVPTSHMPPSKATGQEVLDWLERLLSPQPTPIMEAGSAFEMLRRLADSDSAPMSPMTHKPLIT